MVPFIQNFKKPAGCPRFIEYKGDVIYYQQPGIPPAAKETGKETLPGIKFTLPTFCDIFYVMLYLLG